MGTRGAHTWWRCPPRPRGPRVWPPRAPVRLPFGLRVPSGKILTLDFVPSNSDNISLLAFLKPKTAENRHLALLQLVNRLVLETCEKHLKVWTTKAK